MIATLRNLVISAIFVGTAFGDTVINGSVSFSATGTVTYSGGANLGAATSIVLGAAAIKVTTDGASDGFSCVPSASQCVPDLSTVSMTTPFNPITLSSFVLFLDSQGAANRYKFEMSSFSRSVGAKGNSLSLAIEGTFTDTKGIYKSNPDAEVILTINQAGGPPGKVSFSGTFASFQAVEAPEPANLTLIGLGVTLCALMGFRHRSVKS